MWLTCNGFSQEYLLKLNLDCNDAYVLLWFAEFSNSGKQESIDKGTGPYYWVKYTKVANDIPLIGRIKSINIGNMFRKLCGQGQPNEEMFPLEKINIMDGKQNRVYFRFRPNVFNLLKEGSMQGLFDASDLPAIPKPVINKNYKKIPVNQNVLDVFNKLKKINVDGKPLFSHESPQDSHHYTSLFGQFQDSMMSLYEGRFLSKHKLGNLEQWFSTKYEYYLDKEKIIEKTRACKNNWVNIINLLYESAERYVKWFDEGSELYDKNKLPRNVNEWLYNSFNNTSMFYVSMIENPTNKREASAERIYNSIPEKYTRMYEPLLKPQFDGFGFWNRVYGLTEWYKQYSDDLISDDSNCAYWLDGMESFMRNYKEWLWSLTDGNIFLSNLGIGNSTWDLYVKQKRKEHDISIKIPRNL